MLTIHMLAQELGEVCQPTTNAVRVGTELHLVGNTTPDAAGRHEQQHQLGHDGLSYLSGGAACAARP